MKKGNFCRFIIVDNDINITLAEVIIQKVVENAEIQSYTLPQVALKHIEAEYHQTDKNIPTLLLLNFQMPAMSGFEFLEAFLKFNDTIKNQFKIFASFSSATKKEIEKALEYSYVIDYRVKPLTISILNKWIEENGLEFSGC